MRFPRSSRPDDLVRRLPFALDDFDAARRVFVRWRGTRDAADLDVVALWAYCYTDWYLRSRFWNERTGGVSDFDLAQDRAYMSILGALESIRDPECFPQYVSVVCRNEVLSHRGRRRETVEMQDYTASVMPLGAGHYDRVLTARLIARAVLTLPPAIGEIAQMRWVDRMEYEAIAEVTGRPIDSVRTYASKALAMLRLDPALLAIHDGGEDEW